MWNGLKYRILTETDDVFEIISKKRLSDEEIAKELKINVEDLVQVDFEDNE